MEITPQRLVLRFHTDVQLEDGYIVMTNRTDPEDEGSTLYISFETLLDNEIKYLLDLPQGPQRVLKQLSVLREIVETAAKRYAQSATPPAGHSC